MKIYLASFAVKDFDFGINPSFKGSSQTAS